MAEMSKELMDSINSGGYCYLATASKEGMPNIAIIGSTRAVSPDTVVLAAGLMNKNLNNLQENPKASIIVYSGLPSDKMQATMEDFSRVSGGQIKGGAAIHTSGEVYEKTKTMLAERMGPQVAEMTKAAIVLKVDEVYSVGLGPQAGKRIS
jgi:predicted pyridoxine 5'-phosphate oxidase superfamily flavin-nucleotide-binding protein